MTVGNQPLSVGTQRSVLLIIDEINASFYSYLAYRGGMEPLTPILEGQCSAGLTTNPKFIPLVSNFK